MTFSDYFIRKDFAYYDSCSAQVVGNLEDRIYDHIRRYTWRGRPATPQASQLVKAGKIYSKISQSKIAEMVGCGRQAANKAISRLKALGWLDVVLPGNQGAAFYITGERVKDSNGSVHEVFYYDAWIRDLWEYLEREAAKEFGEEKDRETGEEDPAPPEHRSSVRLAPISWRILKTTSYVSERLARNGDGVASGDRGCRLENAKQLSSVPEATGGVVSGRQGVSSQGDIRSTEDTEEENQEGIETLSAPSACERESGVPDSDSLSPELEQPADAADGASVHMDADSRMTKLTGAQADSVARTKEQIRRNRTKSLEKKRADEQRQANLKSEGPKSGQIDELEKIWAENMRLVFPEKTPAKWVGKERGQAKKLIAMYDFATIREALLYMVCKWEEVNERFLKGNGSYPTIGFLLSMHGVLVLEAQGTSGVTGVEKEIEEWRKANPNVARTPAHLKEKLARAKRAAGQ